MKKTIIAFVLLTVTCSFIYATEKQFPECQPSTSEDSDSADIEARKRLSENWDYFKTNDGLMSFYFVDTLTNVSPVLICNPERRVFAVTDTTDLRSLDFDNILKNENIYLISSNGLFLRLFSKVHPDDIKDVFGIYTERTDIEEQLYVRLMDSVPESPGFRFGEFTLKPTGYMVILIEGKFFIRLDSAFDSNVRIDTLFSRSDPYAYYKMLIPYW